MLFDLLLAAAVMYGAYQLRVRWTAARAHQRVVLEKRVKPVPPPPVSPMQPPAPAVPAVYGDIAQKMLFSKDRNSTVVVDAPPPKPPKPMPPLPVVHGVMNIGEGPSAVLSEKSGGPHREFKPGQQIGEFKLVSVNSREIVLDWDGQKIVRKIDELIDKSPPQQSAADERPVAAPPAAAATSEKPGSATGPGVDIGQGFRACQSGDNTPAGTVVDGMKKNTWQTPFGMGCRWDPVK